MNKVVIIGCGNVGMSYAYLLVTSDNNIQELVLIDINEEKAKGEALDLIHASAYSNSSLKIKAGSYLDCKDATIVCVCAGKNQDEGETRLDLLDKNVGVFNSIINEIEKSGFAGIYLVATNPVDLLTYYTYKISNKDPKKVIGSGTTLDSARFKSILARRFDVNPKSVHSYVIGEHGDSEVVCFSNATIGLNNVELTRDEEKRITEEVKTSAYKIIKRKGNTSYGIGVCLNKITNAILEDSKEIMTVSSYNKEHDCYFGVPSSIGKDGINEVFYVKLNNKEEKELFVSISLIKETIKILKEDKKI